MTSFELPTPQAALQLTGSQSSRSVSFNSSSRMMSNKELGNEEEEMCLSALSSFRAKEDQIHKKKTEVRDRLLSQLGRVQQETKRLATIRVELEAMSDPMRKDVIVVRKKIDSVNKELKSLGHNCQKKEREYKEALDSFNEKNKEKIQLITKLMELVTESEKLRMIKLEELSKNL